MAYIGNTPAEKYISISSQTFTTINGTGYTLSSSVNNSEDIALFLNNIRQKPSTYTATGTSLTMGSATTTADELYCVYLGKALQTVSPGDASIGTAQLADDSITNAKVKSDAAIATSKISGAVTSIASNGLAASATTDTTDAGNIASGTLPDGRFPATLPAINGSAVTNLNAANLTTNTVAVARGGTNIGSYAAGDLLYASGATTLGKLNKPGSDKFLKNTSAGTLSWADAGGGLVLQAVGMTKTDTTSYGTASWADITGMSLAITPTKASSKILLNVNCSFGGKFAGMAAKVVVDINGGGYNDLLVGDAAGSRTSATFGLNQASSNGGYDGYACLSYGMSYLYTPTYTLTDVITFKVQWNATEGVTMYLNQQHDNTDNANYVRLPSMMTAMEID